MEVKNLLRSLDRYPPYLIRLIARKCHGRKPMTNMEIAAQSGLSVRTVAMMSRRKSWADTTISTASSFCSACGCDILRPRRINDYMKRSGFIHIKNDKRYERFMSRILDNINDHRQDSAANHSASGDQHAVSKDR